ncbi:hypothetical protein DFH94DRAFT_713312 [Russula ochroleuca]|uniref:Uncharacterized protein n=1 Tax=Russula ochroleuca TaxID=152965 RepID=A0A9P5TDI1_9AGAM|nr:hypothetical protein DFH94DRAFT_713312 [Russula ochroleuca]
MGSLTSALDRLNSSKSLKYSPSGRPFIQRVYVAFAANSDMYLSFLRQCTDYGEKVFTCLPSIVLPTSSRMGGLHNLREQTTRLRVEMTAISAENAASVQGSRKFKAEYKKALSLETKTTSGLNTLVEKLSSWVTITYNRGLRDDALSDVITLEQHRRLWAKARDSVGAALATLKNEPSPQLIYRSDPLASKGPRSVMRRWMTNLVHCL